MARTRKKKNIKGVGDAIAAVTSAVGIEPCENCKNRKDFLNVIWPFNKPKPLTNEQIELLQGEVSDEQYIELYNDLFNRDIKSDCRSNVLIAIKRKVNRHYAYTTTQ